MNKDNDPESTPQEEVSIGDLLRTEREKKGISKSRLAEDIKVREHVIDALENEEWDKLPARVFIKGFIRSYTISIGYDTKKALRLFDKSAPSKGEDSPVPLTCSRKKSRAVYYAIPILVILAVAAYLFTVKDKVEDDIQPAQAVTETSVSPEETGPAGLPEQEQSIAPASAGEVKESEARESEDQKKVLPEPEKRAIPEVASPQIQENKTEELEIENTPVENARETVQEEESTPEEEPYLSAYEEEAPASEEVSDAPPAQLMTLSAKLLERTYVKIIVDDNPPKEFIFQAGANPDWKAERGFEVTVGNAAGIEFIFNGETFNNIGRAGRVKTLHFPEDFETNWEEE